MNIAATTEAIKCEWCNDCGRNATHTIRDIPVCAGGVAWYQRVNPSQAEREVIEIV